jgi:hypothetical protein
MKYLALLVALSRVAFGYLISTDIDSSTCTSSETDGKATFCCTGSCKDGSFIGDAGQCQYWTDLCNDADTTPTCSPNQVFYPGSPDYTWVNSGDGNCYLPAIDDCDWQRNNWFWKCCDCPEGYASTQGGVCDTSTPLSYHCVKCSDPDEVLTADFQCFKPLGIDCNIVS